VSFIDTNVAPSQQKDIDPNDPPIEATTRYVQSDQVPIKLYKPSTLPYTQSDLALLAQRIQRQGNFFFGRECRTPESAWALARDLLYVCDLMEYTLWDKLSNVDIEGVVPGSPGNFEPSNAEIPADLEALRDCGDLGQTTPWQSNEYVVLGDSSTATWIGNPTADEPWNRMWNKSQATYGMCFPAEATITAQDQANADKLTILGYNPNPSTDWGANTPITIGLYQFKFNGTDWAPADPV
jgi:hypothetical protein